MGLRINTNMSSINAQRQLRGTLGSQAQAEERMASGFRINKSADDAAGLAISTSLTGQIRGLQQATRNAQDGISFVQVAEGGMSEVSSMINRLREIGVQAASDTIGQPERVYIDREAQQLKLEIDRIAQGTNYNGMNLLNGSGNKLDFQVGIKNNDFLDRISYDPSKTDVTLKSLGIEGLDLTDKKNAQESLGQLDKSLATISENRAFLGALQSRLGSTINNSEVSVENFSAARSRIRDADVAMESSELARSNIMLQAGVAVNAQANQSQAVALKLIG